MVVLKNHEADNQRVAVRCPGHHKFLAFETDVQEQIRQQIPVRDGKISLSLLAYEWKLLYLTWQNKQEEG